MEAGHLRHRVQLDHYTVAANAVGDPVKSWASVAEVWASIEPLSGRELEWAQQQHAQAAIRVTMRYRAGIDTTYRIRFGTRTFEVLAVVNPDERNETLVVTCRETA